MDLRTVSPMLNLYNHAWPIRSAMLQYPPVKFVFDTDGPHRHGDRTASSPTAPSSPAAACTTRSSSTTSSSTASATSTSRSSCRAATSAAASRLRRVICDKYVTIEDGTVIGEDPVDRRRAASTSARAASSSSPRAPSCRARGRSCRARSLPPPGSIQPRIHEPGSVKITPEGSEAEARTDAARGARRTPPRPSICASRFSPRRSTPSARPAVWPTSRRRCRRRWRAARRRGHGLHARTIAAAPSTWRAAPLTLEERDGPPSCGSAERAASAALPHRRARRLPTGLRRHDESSTTARHLYVGADGARLPDNVARFAYPLPRRARYWAGRARRRPTSCTPTTGRRALAPVYLRTCYRRAPLARRAQRLHHPQPRLPGPRPPPRDSTPPASTGAYFHPGALEFYGQLNLMKGGLVFADAMTTVSPTLRGGDPDAGRRAAASTACCAPSAASCAASSTASTPRAGTRPPIRICRRASTPTTSPARRSASARCRTRCALPVEP